MKLTKRFLNERNYYNNNNYFFVNEIESIGDEEKTCKNVNGFIHGSILAVATWNYAGEEINLYADSTENSNIVTTINKEVQLTLKSANTNGEWIKVKW